MRYGIAHCGQSVRAPWKCLSRGIFNQPRRLKSSNTGMEPAVTAEFDNTVTRGDLESLLASVEQRVANPRAGIFGRGSISWKINRESALFLGAGRAALLQLAHPWVAAALDQHSNLRNDPLGRFHNTFRVVFTMVFGTLDQALAASRALYQMHTRIRGELPA